MILTVKKRDKLNSKGSWFILLSAFLNRTKETSAITLKKDTEIRYDTLGIWYHIPYYMIL